MTRYLFDTNVLVAALRSRRGASHLLLQEALSAVLPLVIHYKLLAEYIDVLARPGILGNAAPSWAAVERLLARLTGDASEIQTHWLWRPNLRDERDNYLIEIAAAAAPCIIVTHNVRDLTSGELSFQGVWIKTPAEVLSSFPRTPAPELSGKEPS